MAFDGFITKSIITELKNNIIGAKVNKVFEPTKNEIIFKKMTAILLLTVTLSVVIENNSFVKEWPIVECHQETPDLGCADYNS